MKAGHLMFMTIYPKSTTPPPEEVGAASAYGGPRLRLLGVGMLRASLWIVMIGLVAGTGAFAQDDGSPVGWSAPVLPTQTSRIG
jgi:hypothetical protein